jgi:heme-degrading monooxygenase HmoA
MIARVWRGRALPDKIGEYAGHLTRTVKPELERIKGFQGMYLLAGDEAGGGEVVVITMWESMEAITAFAGDTPRAAVVAPNAQPMFRDYDELVSHYEVLLRPGA